MFFIGVVSDSISGILSDILSGILAGIPSGILFDTFGINFEILSGM
jgi:hypothetical protein